MSRKVLPNRISRLRTMTANILSRLLMHLDAPGLLKNKLPLTKPLQMPRQQLRPKKQEKRLSAKLPKKRKQEKKKLSAKLRRRELPPKKQEKRLSARLPKKKQQELKLSAKRKSAKLKRKESPLKKKLLIELLQKKHKRSNRGASLKFSTRMAAVRSTKMSSIQSWMIWAIIRPQKRMLK